MVTGFERSDALPSFNFSQEVLLFDADRFNRVISSSTASAGFRSLNSIFRSSQTWRQVIGQQKFLLLC